MSPPIGGGCRWARRSSELNRLLTNRYFPRIASYIQTSWIIKTIKYYCRITISILLNG